MSLFSVRRMELRSETEENECRNDWKHTESSEMTLSDAAVPSANGWWSQMEGADMGGYEGFQWFLRCVLHSWSWLCGPHGGACREAGGHQAVSGGGAREGGTLMSRSTGEGVGGGAQCRPL